ncbi:MAG: DUF5615 family PIN-like protein, partial [bacterium]|nr:DUF5615 family PIN-like protein [bacterium]
MLKIYMDENVERAIADGLKRRNIEAWSANEMNNLGLNDEQQLECAVRKKASFFTYDSDFFDIGKRWASEGKIHYGIFYIHPLNTNIGDCIRKIKEYA